MDDAENEFDEVTGAYTVEPPPMTWRERFAFRRQLRAEARAERKAARADRRLDRALIKSARKEVIKRCRAIRAAARFDRKYAGYRQACGALNDATAIGSVTAATRVMDGVRDTRDRRFRYVATIGTWALVLLLAFMAMCCAPRGVARPQSTQVNATVSITTWCVDDSAFPSIGFGYQRGSGVIVGTHRVLTAQHVVTCKQGHAAVRVDDANGKTYTASIDHKFGTGADVASLTTDEPFTIPPAAIGPPPRVGASVCMSTATPERTYQCGTVTEYFKNKPGNLVSTLPVQKGNSGSGLYDRTGKLVGIMTHLVPCLIFTDEDGNIVGLFGTCGGRATTLRGTL